MLISFYIAIVLLLISAFLFTVPPIWLATGTAQLSRPMRIIASGSLVLLLTAFSVLIYSKIGAANHLRYIYSAENRQKQQSAKLIRPLYARLQRELIKNQLDLKLDLENIDLILNFAQIQSQAQQGILEPTTQTLLNSVLAAIPQQVTALNLLAVHAYKTENYAQAIAYWRAILQQFTPEMRNTQVERILQDKITQTAEKLVAFKKSAVN